MLLILRCDKLHIGVSEDISKLVSHRIRIDRNRNRAQRLRCHERPIELRPVGTHDGDRVSWLQSKSLQAGSISANDLCDLSPGPRLPDAEILMPKRRTAAKLRGISQKQLGERVKRSANDHVGLHPKNRHVGSRLLMATRALQAAAMRVPHALLHNTRDRKSHKSRLDRPGPGWGEKARANLSIAPGGLNKTRRCRARRPGRGSPSSPSRTPPLRCR